MHQCPRLIAGDVRDAKRLYADGNEIKGSAWICKNVVVPGNVMLTDKIEVASENAAGQSAVVISACLECVIRSQQTERSGAGEDFCVGCGGQTRRGILLIIND